MESLASFNGPPVHPRIFTSHVPTNFPIIFPESSYPHLRGAIDVEDNIVYSPMDEDNSSDILDLT